MPFTGKLFNAPPRDPARIKEVLGQIESVWQKYPDMRFYQVISLFERDYAKKDKYHVEDETLLEGISDFKKLRGLK